MKLAGMNANGPVSLPNDTETDHIRPYFSFNLCLHTKFQNRI